jgi:fumarate hydratase class II
MGQSIERRLPVRRAPRPPLGELRNDLLPALEALGGLPRAQAAEFDDIVKSGRTHLDGRRARHARPGVLGLRRSGQDRGIARVGDAMPRLGQIPLGGTATGTGPEHASRVRRACASTSRETGLTISAPGRHFEAQAARDGLVEAPARSRSSPFRSRRSRTTFGSWGPGPRAGSRRSSSRSCRRELDHAGQGQTRSSPRS